MIRVRYVILFVGLSVVSIAQAEWPQWRGPNRTGFVDTDDLVDSLPSDGIAAKWKLESFSGGNNGGWSSPVISDGRVFVYSHTKTKSKDAPQGPREFPWLPEEKRVGMTEEEYAEYEVNRRDEDERIAGAFRFDERMVCLALESGEVMWERSDASKYSRFVQSGTPCVADGRVFVLGAARTARCYDAATGDVLWSRRLPGDFRDQFFSSSFVVSGDTAMVACGPLIALSTSDGQIKWKGDAPLDYLSHSSPAIWDASSGPIAIINSTGGTTHAYRISDGVNLWELDSGASQSTPIVIGDQLLTYGSSRKNGLKAFQLFADAPDKLPEMIWRFQRASDSGSTPVVRGDAVFVQGERRLAKLRLSDGDTMWQTTMKLSNPRYTSLIAAGDQVFYAWEGLLAFEAEGDDFVQLYEAKVDSERVLITSDDLREKLQLDQIDSEEGGQQKSEQLWQQRAIRSGPLNCSTPAVSDGRMVLRLRDAVVCYDLRR